MLSNEKNVSAFNTPKFQLNWDITTL